MAKKNTNTEEYEPEAEQNELATVTCKDATTKRLYFKPEKKGTSGAQNINYPKYLYNGAITKSRKENDSENLIFITQPIKMVKGGIPRYNPKHHGENPNSKKRTFFYIPFDETQEACVELFDMIDRFDDFLDTEINENGNKNGIISYKTKDGKVVPYKNITYQRMKGQSRGPDNEDEDEDKPEYKPYTRIKAHLATKYEENLGDNDTREIETQVFVEDNEDPEDVTTVEGVEKNLTWNSTAQFVLTFNKFWIAKSGKMECGMGIKCHQIGITERAPTRQSASNQLKKKLFARSGGATKRQEVEEVEEEEVEEDEVEESEEEVEEVEEDESEEEEDDEEEEEEDDEEEEEDDEEEEEEVQPKKVKVQSKKAAEKSGKKKATKTK